MPQLWPQNLEPDRLAALAAVQSARPYLACALQHWDRAPEAVALSAAACRDCLRLVAVATDYRPPAGRWSSKFVALRQLLDEHATVGLVLAQTVKGGREGDRRAALIELIEVMADIHFYLEQLVRRHNGVSI